MMKYPSLSQVLPMQSSSMLDVDKSLTKGKLSSVRKFGWLVGFFCPCCQGQKHLWKMQITALSFNLIVLFSDF